MKHEHLYHVTRAANLDSILARGLDASLHGAVHGSMDVAPPRPAVYLSRKPGSDNLHADLFDGSPLVVLKVATTGLDPDEMWPDDFVYDAVSEGDLLGTVGAVRKALGCDAATARRTFEAIEAADDLTFPEVLRPFWSWYLDHPRGGEVAYTADVPPGAVVGWEPYHGRGAAPGHDAAIEDVAPGAPTP